MTATLADAGLAMLMSGAVAAIQPVGDALHEIETADEASIEPDLAPQAEVRTGDADSGAAHDEPLVRTDSERAAAGPSPLPQVSPVEMKAAARESGTPRAAWLTGAREGLAAGLARLSGRVRVSFGRRRQGDD